MATEDTQQENQIVSPDDSYLWAVDQIHSARPDTPHELIGTAHIVVQLYALNAQLNTLNQQIYIALSPESIPEPADNPQEATDVRPGTDEAPTDHEGAEEE